MRLFLFGAGATIGTLGLPGVKQFGPALERCAPSWWSDAKYSKLARFVAEMRGTPGDSSGDWYLDELWTRLDYVAKLFPALESLGAQRDDGGEASQALHRAVAAVYGPLNEHALSEAWRGAEPFTLRAVLGQVQPGDVVVSLNWDVLVEWLLMNCRFPLRAARVVQMPHSSSAGDVRFVKPHGSLSWRRTMPAGLEPDFEWSNNDGSPLTRAMRPEDIRNESGVIYQPLLLGAIPIKSEILREVQGNEHSFVHSRVMEQWKALCEALRDSDELHVVGYSFPPEDGYGHFMLAEAARARRGRPCRVLLHEVRARHDEVAARIASILGLACRDVLPQGPVQSPRSLLWWPR
jgi:hypothetical protein